MLWYHKGQSSLISRVVVIVNQKVFNNLSSLKLNQFISTLFFFFLQAQDQCVWYGVCNQDATQNKQYCPYDGPPKPTTDKMKELLRLRCPHLLNETHLCCDEQMVCI